MKQMKKDRRALYGIAVLAATALLLAADQILKHFVLLYLKPQGSVTVVKGFLELTYVENTGAAFGLLKNQIWLVKVITVAAFAAMVFLLFRYKNHTVFSYITLALLLSGGIGNLLDRIFYGFVVDFIHVLFFDYIFNFADCCITVGAVLVVFHVFLVSRREQEREGEGASQEEERK